MGYSYVYPPLNHQSSKNRPIPTTTNTFKRDPLRAPSPAFGPPDNLGHIGPSFDEGGFFEGEGGPPPSLKETFKPSQVFHEIPINEGFSSEEEFAPNDLDYLDGPPQSLNEPHEDVDFHVRKMF